MHEIPPRPGTPDAAASLEMRLFGPIEVRIEGRPLPHLRSRKGLWLLALLALRNGRNVDRDWIAGTLWPDCDERHGRINLRQSLHDLRIALGSQAFRLASDEPRSLRLDLSSVFVDALEFDALIGRGDPDSLAAAAALHRGPLLEDCSEEWAVDSRRQREQSLMHALESLVSEAMVQHDFAAAADRARKALHADPYREDLLRTLMEALEAGGSSAAAMAAYREYRAMLGRELMGEPAEETAALFRRIKEEARSCSRPAADTNPSRRGQALPSARRTLPTPLTPLIGREEEVRQVIALAEGARLITLTGTGGVGKTRLSIRIGEELTPQFPDGVFFVDLAPVDKPEALPDAVRIACATPEIKDVPDVGEALIRYLADRRVLVILDNCERISRACGQFAQRLLTGCPSLTILATSRDVLDVRGERVWRVPSLGVPRTGSGRQILPSQIDRVDAFREYAAVRLFAERARDAEPAFDLTMKSSVAVAKICSLLDGIPLAIELAAARVKGMPVEKIAERLNDRFRILLGRGDALPGAPVPRHQTLRTSIEWSYDLLTQREQTLLRRLAVFVGGWTLEAAEAVCSGGAVPEWEVLDLLTRLVDRSLVVYHQNLDRYRLLETIRQYLRDRSNEEGMESELPERHLAHFLELSEAAETGLISAAQSEGMDRLETDHDNLRAALRFAAGPGGDVEAGLRLSGAIWRFWDIRGYSREGRRWLSLLLQASTGAPPSAARAKALFGAGELAFRYGDITASRSYQEECLQAQEALGNRVGAARSLNALGNAASVQGSLEEAAAYYARGLSISRELGDRRLIAVALNNLGNLAVDRGDLAEARRLQEENLRLRREIGDQRGIAIALNNLAIVAKNEGDYAAAKALHAECLPLQEALGNRRGAAVTLSNLGNTILLMGDALEAEPVLVDSLRVLWELGDRSSVASTLEALAAARSSLGWPLEAALLWGAADRLRNELGVPAIPGEAARYRECLAEARRQVGDAAFDASWNRGRTMDLGAVIAAAVTRERVAKVELAVDGRSTEERREIGTAG